MTEEVPDRTGWLRGNLASAAPVPPFPQLTDFERKALDEIAVIWGEDAPVFRAQVESARVLDRVNTCVGFYTRVEVDRARTRPLQMRARGAHFNLDGLECPFGVLLWEDGGYLETIEGHTYAPDSLEGVDLASLTFVGLVQLD